MVLGIIGYPMIKNQKENTSTNHFVIETKVAISAATDKSVSEPFKELEC